MLDSYLYAYDAAGRRTSVQRTDNSYVNYGYDNLGELTGARGYEPSQMPRANENLGYGYDAAGNLLLRTNNTLIQAFTLDNANELVNVQRNNNLLTVAGSLSSPVASLAVNGQAASVYGDQTYAVPNGVAVADGLNTLTAVANGTQTSRVGEFLPVGAHLQYDLNGNLLSDGERTYAYDCANELIQVVATNAFIASSLTTTNSYLTKYAYDGLGRRRVRQDYEWKATTTQSGTTYGWVKANEVHYVYDGMAVVQERDANNNVLVTYTRGVDLSGTFQGAGGVGGLLARTDSRGSSAYYHTDGNGNVTMLVDSAGNLLAKYLYDSFGNTLGMWGTLAPTNTYRFSSKEIDLKSGLYYYGFRYYQPNLQRWLNHDPIGERGGINLYQFVNNDPIDLFDLFGLRPPTGPQGGYVDPFGNWHESFCMSCHDNTPAGNFYSSQAMAANNQSWGMFAYQQGLGLGLGLGLGGIADDMTLDAMMEAEQASQLAQMGKGIVCKGKVVAHAPLEAITSHEQLARQSGTLLQAPQAGTPGVLVPGAEAFTYSAQGPNVFVTGSMNFNSNVSENTVQVVTMYLTGKK